MNYNMKHFLPSCLSTRLWGCSFFLLLLLLMNTRISPVWSCEASQITAIALGMSMKWGYTIDSMHTGSGERIFGQQRSLVERAIVLLSNCGNIHMVVISGKNECFIFVSFSPRCLNKLIHFLFFSSCSSPPSPPPRLMTCTLRLGRQATSL